MRPRDNLQARWAPNNAGKDRNRRSNRYSAKRSHDARGTAGATVGVRALPLGQNGYRLVQVVVVASSSSSSSSSSTSFRALALAEGLPGLLLTMLCLHDVRHFGYSRESSIGDVQPNIIARRTSNQSSQRGFHLRRPHPAVKKKHDHLHARSTGSNEPATATPLGAHDLREPFQPPGLRLFVLTFLEGLNDLNFDG